MDSEEEKRLRAAALKTSESIRIVRQSAERALVAANEELERKNEELQEQREWFAVTLASIGDAVITTDTQGLVTFLNPVAESMTGWTSEEARGRPLEQVFHIINEVSQLAAPNPVNNVLQLGRVIGLANHTALIARNGTVVAIEDSAAPIRGQNGNLVGVVLVFRDVSERRRTEQVLREADRRKDEFLATLAHELRNPLAPIRTAAQILVSPELAPEQLQWAQSVIQRQVRHMALLLDDLLDIARITQGKLELKMERINLMDIVDSAVEAARPLLDTKQHSLVVSLPAEALILDADPLRLSQVLSNLLTNAAKYTDPAGHIELSASVQCGELRLSVKDNGIGIPVGSLNRIFEMFSQVETAAARTDGGLGIGLALVKGLVELHGGAIEARSDGPGLGSEFAVRLPLAASDVAAVPTNGTVAPPIASSGRRVLVADDNKDAADSLAMVLELSGHDVRVAHGGRAALALAQTFRPDVALLDIGMPELNGYEVAKELRREPWATGILLIALTGWGQDDDRQRAKDAGFNHHLTKPLDLDTLETLLANSRAILPKL
jgi:PAS domain S-box-containing protein